MDEEHVRNDGVKQSFFRLLGESGMTEAYGDHHDEHDEP